MNLIFQIALLVLGFALLIKGSDFFVNGSASLSLRFNISPIVIGLSVVAFGTSSPELLINLFASLNGADGISFGNIFGSNILNTLLILGIAGIITPLSTPKNTVWREIPFLLLATLAIFVLVNDSLFNGKTEDVYSRGDAIISLLFFAIFIVYLFIISKVEGEHSPDIKIYTVWKITLFILGGLVFLVVGAKLVVDNGVLIAKFLGLSDRIIGLTIIAVGTSLPELSTTVVAAKKGHQDLAIGNVIGSSIFNILFILPATGLISPLAYDPSSNLDLVVMFASSVLLFFAMFTGKKRILDRWEAVAFIGIYLIYMIILFLN